MSTNAVPNIIPADVVAQALAGLNDVKTLLQPYMHPLTVDERRDLPKMSDKSLSFVTKVDSYCSTNPEFIPSFMDAAEMDADFKTVSALKPLFDIAEQISSNLDDTIMFSGHGSYVGGLMYYANVQMFAKTGQANAKTILEDLRQRFEGMGKKKKGGNGQP